MRRVKKDKMSWKTKLKIISWLVVIGAGYALYQSPVGQEGIKSLQRGYMHLAEKAHFVLDQVIIDPLQSERKTTQAALNKALSLRQGMPIFDIDLEEKRQALLELPWVKEAVIERHLPATLYIHLEEKTPIAVWQNKKKYYPLDEQGKAIYDSQTHLENLILVVGTDAPQQTPPLMKALKAYPEIREKVRSAQRVGNRRWNLYLFDAESGLEIRLPEEDIEAALARLSAINTTEKLLKKDLQMIDLRYPNRLPIRIREGVKNVSK